MEALPPSRIFSIATEAQFEAAVRDTLDFQYHVNSVYQEFCNHLGFHPNHSYDLKDIPFLPIDFFKSHQVNSHSGPYIQKFQSSGTTGQVRSTHYLPTTDYYKESFIKAFELFYGPVEDYCILALLPNYLEQQHSSLVYMVNHLQKRSQHPLGGFYLNEHEALLKQINAARGTGSKILLIGVSFALLDLAEQLQADLDGITVMETGGMKGRRTEIIRQELHQRLQAGLGVQHIHSEYGMTELLSQSYSTENALFKSPPWKRILIRDAEDPLSLAAPGKSGGINVIDLANQHSCSFIATQDLGRWRKGGFEVLGRFDHAEVRGCNLMVAT